VLTCSYTYVLLFTAEKETRPDFEEDIDLEMLSSEVLTPSTGGR